MKNAPDVKPREIQILPCGRYSILHIKNFPMQDHPAGLPGACGEGRVNHVSGESRQWEAVYTEVHRTSDIDRESTPYFLTNIDRSTPYSRTA
jgi:hypothetical protein